MAFKLPLKPGVRVTDILIRGGGGTITFSDDHTEEFFYRFIPDKTVPAGGIFTITLVEERANLVYQNVIDQALCDTIDWLLQCSDINRRLLVLEERLGIATEITFTAADWDAGTANQVTVIASGTPGAGEVGPHELAVGTAYHITVFRDDGTPVTVGVDIEVSINVDTGDVTLIKAPLASSFDGRVIIG